MGPGEGHRPATLDHRHEVCKARDVGGAGRARAHQRRHLWDHAAHHHLLAEQVPGAGEQRAHGLLDPRPGAVEQPHQRDPLGERQLPQARDFELSGHTHRARHHREVVGDNRDQPAVDLAIPGDCTVGGRVPALHRALGEVRPAVDAELDEGPLVDQQGQSLAGRELLTGVLSGHLLLSPTQLGQLPARSKILGEWAQQAGGGRLCAQGAICARGLASCSMRDGLKVRRLTLHFVTPRGAYVNKTPTVQARLALANGRRAGRLDLARWEHETP